MLTALFSPVLTFSLPSLSMFFFFALRFSLPLPVQAIYPDVLWLFLFFFAVYAPSLLPLSFVCVLSFLNDVASGAPLGWNGMILLTLYGVVAVQRRFLYVRSFIALWAIVVVLMLLGVFFQGVGASFLSLDGLTPVVDIRFACQFLATCLGYPLVHMFCSFMMEKIT